MIETVFRGVLGASVLVFAILLTLRIGAARRNRLSLLTWWGTFFGLIGFLSLGVVIPYETLDKALGGTNVLVLVTAESTMVAFGICFTASLKTAVAGGKSRARYGLLAACMVAVVILFFLTPNRGPSSVTFLNEHLASSPTLLVAVGTYAIVLFEIARDSYVLLGKHTDGIGLKYMRAAMLLMAASAAIYFIYCVMFLFGINVGWRFGLYQTFAGIFHLAVAILLAGFLAAAIKRQSFVWFFYAQQLHQIMRRIEKDPAYGRIEKQIPDLRALVPLPITIAAAVEYCSYAVVSIENTIRHRTQDAAELVAEADKALCYVIADRLVRHRRLELVTVGLKENIA